jgi:hypothetical protein
LEISLGVVVADVSYQPGDRCDNRGDSILVGRVHTLVVVALVVVTICYCDKAVVWLS